MISNTLLGFNRSASVANMSAASPMEWERTQQLFGVEQIF
jgi:hypothetical protein